MRWCPKETVPWNEIEASWYSISISNGVIVQTYLQLYMVSPKTSRASLFRRSFNSAWYGIRLWSFKTRDTKYLAKIRVFKVDYFILPLFLVPKMRSVAQNEWKKNTHTYFFTFNSKINKFEQKRLENKTKNSKNLKVACNYPNI